jgi:hypothetical protein
VRRDGKRSIPAVLTASLLLSTITATTASAAPETPEGVFGSGWQTSGDRAWTTSGDGDGFHVLVADAGDGYAWRTAATLSEPGFDTDRWIGNACVTGSGDRAVVVYAPRTFTNEPDLTGRGGFTAVVHLTSGEVTKLPVHTSLAYFNPGCGTGETAVLTQEGTEDLGRTRLLELDAASATTAAPIDVPGQLTSATPMRDGIVAADLNMLVKVGKDGKRSRLAKASSVPHRIRADADGGVVFVDREGDRATVRRVHDTKTTTLATGGLRNLGIASSAQGTVFLTGKADQVQARDAVVLTDDKDATVSTTGRVVVPPPRPADQLVTPTEAQPVKLTVRVPATGRSTESSVHPARNVSPNAGSGRTPAPVGSAPESRAAGSPHDTVEAERMCSVARNDPAVQVYQPTPREVEWAANYAVYGRLPAQGMFPLPPLEGGGQVPAQLLLGVMAQESNLWQAGRAVMPGQAGNPLIGNYYGRFVGSAQNPANEWDIRWDKADCGYGMTQMTDGMRMKGREKPGEVALPYEQQHAIATSYEANLAAGLQLLHRKWNELARFKVNGGNPRRLESWFYVVWAYNSGFHAYDKRFEEGRNGAWGLGWLNNPANPRYAADRTPFGKDPTDLATPQRWPYPEKVMGFAAYPVWGFEAPGKPVPGYRGGGWLDDQARDFVQPPPQIFCKNEPPVYDNDCRWGTKVEPTDPEVIGEPAGPCHHRNAAEQYDLRCWVHFGVGGKLANGIIEWKDCWAEQNNRCGQERLRFLNPDAPRQPRGSSYPPRCGTGTDAGLPANALVIDDVPDGVAPVSNPSCVRAPNSGTFQFTFAGDGSYPSKIDTHQIGGGYGAHFWFAHTWTNGPADKLKVTGTWRLNRAMNGWARVLVHMPDHGAHTQQARYRVDRGNGTVPNERVLLQRTQEHSWVSLGVFEFTGVPSVSLDNITKDNKPDPAKPKKAWNGIEDVAWDAIAFEPLPGKPEHQIVSLGDSYSSGEGTGGATGERFYRETDNNGDNVHRNACHRSKDGWPLLGRLSSLGDVPVRTLVEERSPHVDFHFLACSGARTREIRAKGPGMFREVSQLDRGFLDENTTLVSLTVGGNDARFSDVITKCITDAVNYCFDSTLAGDTEPLKVALPKRLRAEVTPAITDLLHEIKLTARHARIVVLGYAPMFEPDTDCTGVISKQESNWLNEMAGLMREAVQAAVAAAGDRVHFADPTDRFTGRRICSASKAINTIILDKTPGDRPLSDLVLHSAQSFHPNRAGVDLLAETYSEKLRELGI